MCFIKTNCSRANSMFLCKDLIMLHAYYDFSSKGKLKYFCFQFLPLKRTLRYDRREVDIYKTFIAVLELIKN